MTRPIDQRPLIDKAPRDHNREAAPATARQSQIEWNTGNRTPRRTLSEWPHDQEIFMSDPAIPNIGPPCSDCGTPTVLNRVVPDIPFYEKRTYECPKCHNSESTIVKCK
jgi:hypothetical protein